jgi:drug/metabolite transporter (DMT)-like permease
MKKWVFIMALVVITEAVSDIFAKEWSLKSHWWIFAIAISGYIATNLFWLWALKHNVGLARGAVLFSAGSAILGVFSGFLLYKEVITITQLVGVILGLVSLILILWE